MAQPNFPPRAPELDSTALGDLRGSGLRVTATRIAVLDAVRDGGHLRVDEIGEGACRRLGSVSTQAVYDVLGALTGAGLIRRIELPGSPVRFESRVGDNHHHLICRTCGSVVDVDCAVGHSPCLEPSSAHGHDIEEAEVIYWGTCPACAPSADAAEPRFNSRRKREQA